MKEVLDRDKERRQELVSLFREAEIFLGKLPLPRRKEVEQTIPNITENLIHKVANLERNDCGILVAGK